MKTSDRLRAFPVTVPPQIDRLYFSARARGGQAVTLVMPAGVQDRASADFGAFEEWAGELDSAYDVLATE